MFSRAEVAAMRDRTRRRNYSAEAEEFRREHARHRQWGLTQRHARKLSRLYGSTANAAAAFQRRADELTCPSSPAQAAVPTACGSAGLEPPGSAPAPPEPVGPKATESEPVEPVVPEPVQPEPVQPEPAEPVQPEPVEPDGVENAASVSSPSGSLSGNTDRCPGRRFCSGRQERRRPRGPGRHSGPEWRGTQRPRSARRIRARKGTESAENQVRRHAGVTGVKDACQRRRASLSARPGRTTSPTPKGCREHIPP